MTTSVVLHAVERDDVIFPYQGSLTDVAIIFFGPTGKVFSGREGSWLIWCFVFIDLPFSLVLDTLLLPGIIPYYFYVHSGSPGSQKARYEKWNKKIFTFRNENPAYDDLRSAIRNNDPIVLRKILDSSDIVSLEEKIQSLQEDNSLPGAHAHIDSNLKNPESWFLPQGDPDSRWKNYSWNQISIIEYSPSVFYSKEADIRRQSNRVETLSLLYGEFQKKASLEKRFYEKVWKPFFSTEIISYDPSVIHNLSQRFDDREKFYDLLDRRIFEKNSLTRDHKFWQDRLLLLLELYHKIPADLNATREKFKNELWKKAISSGLIVHSLPALRMAFQDFPSETQKSIRILFREASGLDDISTMNLIEKNIRESKGFIIDREDLVLILRYPKILEKLIQVGLDPNLILKSKKTLVRDGQKTELEEQESLLFLNFLDTADEDASVESFRVLLNYGADLDLGVRRYDSWDGHEFVFYPRNVLFPASSVPSKIMRRKQKLWEGRKAAITR
ncbi:YceK/YidQ family lipoprotein [Leptospira gomenensis]|nr:YceK/YidQ family lipoprotein [Leptospira gomenensis]